jgi:hypothetical protein
MPTCVVEDKIVEIQMREGKVLRRGNISNWQTMESTAVHESNKVAQTRNHVLQK